VSSFIIQNDAILKLAAASVAFNSPQEGEGAPVQDLMAELDPLEWAGVAIGREDAYRLYQNLKKLSASSGATGLRFWGKILGRNGDYYIAEVYIFII
jgi:radial spoke head protein 4A